jgi:hypothetical protein
MVLLRYGLLGANDRPMYPPALLLGSTTDVLADDASTPFAYKLTVCVPPDEATVTTTCFSACGESVNNTEDDRVKIAPSCKYTLNAFVEARNNAIELSLLFAVNDEPI